MRRLQLAGHRPIALLGTGTTLIGDPTGRTDMRKMLTPEAINYNAECFKRQMEKFIDFSDDRALMLRNGDWLCKLNYIELLRDVGVYFSVNQMLTMDSVKTRLERGLSFLEFNYMIMQSYDFLKPVSYTHLDVYKRQAWARSRVISPPSGRARGT